MGARSTEKLVAALKDAGAPADLVLRAVGDAFHDFRSSSATPILDLVRACEHAGLFAIAQRAKAGEFDAGPAEADEWANSPDGQRTFKQLTDEIVKGKP